MTNLIQYIREIDNARVEDEKECAVEQGEAYEPMFELVTIEPKGVNVNLYFREGDPVEDAMQLLINCGLFEERDELPEFTTYGRVAIIHNVRNQ